jgi:hypothetical protein
MIPDKKVYWWTGEEEASNPKKYRTSWRAG